MKQGNETSRFSEHSFLRWLRDEYPLAAGKSVGIGDDAAWSPHAPGEGVLWAMDTVVEGIHFKAGADAPSALGRKAVLVNLSDIAAMGGIPDGVLLSIALGSGQGEIEAKSCVRAAAAVCEEHNVRLLGGDTVRTKGPMVVTVAMSGHAPDGQVLRSGAGEGDAIVVTGALGGSFHDGRHADFTPRLAEAQAMMGEARPSAMTDISDGLARDLTNILDASGVGALLEAETIPVHPSAEKYAQITGKDALWHALHDGEDFELLLTISPVQLKRLLSGWKLDTPLTVIGRVEGDILLLNNGGEQPVIMDAGGFDHGEV